MVTQYQISLPPYPRGFHVITEKIIESIGNLPKCGLLHIFIKHTSAGICVNEAADPNVLVDFESIFNKLVPENMPFLTHTIEGSDDMPAHIKSALVGHGITLPITDHRINLGIWQGIYLCEFRNKGGSRKLVVTVLD